MPPKGSFECKYTHHVGLSSLQSGRGTISSKRWGRFYTPAPIAKVAVDWAIREKSESVIDVATGEGVFLVEAIRRLKELGATSDQIANQLFGTEISKVAYRKARQRLSDIAGISADKLVRADFFDTVPTSNSNQLRSPRNRIEIPLAQAVVGNPPFVRYSLMKNDSRIKAVRRIRELGLELRGPVDASVLFLIHASTFLRPSGRLALVMPERVLFTKYGSLARDYLKARFQSIELILCNGWSFGEAAERVVLILATNSGKGGMIVKKMEYDERRFPNVEPIQLQVGQISREETTEEAWSMLRFGMTRLALFKKLVAIPNVHKMKDLAEVEIGCVTGANGYFVINRDAQNKYLLPQSCLVPAVSKARQITGLTFRMRDWDHMFNGNENCMLLKVDPPVRGRRGKNVQNYLRMGRRLGINTRYKPSHRAKWYSVPEYKPPTAFFTYMSHRYPRLVLNSARAINTNAIHSVRLKVIERGAFCTGFYNSLTLLSCELLGRLYSDGVLKLEPSELNRALVIDPSELGIAGKLKTASNKIHGRLLRGDLGGVFDIIDPIVLGEGLGFSDPEIWNLRNTYFELQLSRIGSSHKSRVYG